MNLLDLIILALLIAAIVRGLMQGGALQIFPLVGFVAGLAIGAALAPLAAGFIDGQFSKAMVTLATIFGSAVLVSAGARHFGVIAYEAIHRRRLGALDAIVGGGVSAITMLIGIWLLAAMFADFSAKPVSNAIHSSAIVRGVTNIMPPAPRILARIQRILDSSGFPDVFAELEPAPVAPVNPPSNPEVRAAFNAAGPSTVRVTGPGCGGIKTGSGFVAAPGFVVTNAHVVAGLDRIIAEDLGGRHRAIPVLFDPDLDLSVLRVTGLSGEPLAIFRSSVRRGTGGAVLGYPEGGPLKGGSAAVLREMNAVGRDIYGRELTRRLIYQLQAEVRSGNSGGPFVQSDGDVIGVVFSSSATDSNVAYALHGRDVAARVDAAKTRQTEVDTGPCTP